MLEQHERLTQHIGAVQARGDYLRRAQLRPLLHRLRQCTTPSAAAQLTELSGWLDAAAAAVELALCFMGCP